MTDDAKAIPIPIQWEAVSFPKNRANCGVFRVVTTKEIMGKEERDVFRHLVDDDAVGNILWIPNGMDYTKVQIPKERAPEPGFKSKAQQLRNVLFVYWREVLGAEGDSEIAYRREMDYVINSYKEQLPDHRR